MSKWSDGSTAVVTSIIYDRPRGLVSEAIRDGAEFTLYRRRRHGKPAPVLVVPLTAEQPSPQSLHRLDHVSTRSQPILSPRWRPSHRRSRVTRGGQSWFSPTRAVRLSRDREKTLDLARLRRLAINLARAPRHVYQCGLIHKNVKSENVPARRRARALAGFLRLLTKNAGERCQTTAGGKPVFGGTCRNGGHMAALIHFVCARMTRQTDC